MINWKHQIQEFVHEIVIWTTFIVHLILLVHPFWSCVDILQNFSLNVPQKKENQVLNDIIGWVNDSTFPSIVGDNKIFPGTCMCSISTESKYEAHNYAFTFIQIIFLLTFSCVSPSPWEVLSKATCSPWKVKCYLKNTERDVRCVWQTYSDQRRWC